MPQVNINFKIQIKLVHRKKNVYIHNVCLIFLQNASEFVFEVALYLCTITTIMCQILCCHMLYYLLTLSLPTYLFYTLPTYLTTPTTYPFTYLTYNYSTYLFTYLPTPTILLLTYLTYNLPTPTSHAFTYLNYDLLYLPSFIQ